MVLPLIPIAIAGVGGGILGSLLGGTKKQELMQEQAGKIDIVVEAEPYQHYAPQQTYQPTPTYTYQAGDILIESPGARTKKEAKIDVSPRVEQRGEWDFPTTVSPKQELAQEGGVGEGTDMVMIAIIAAVGVVAYGLVSKK